jgi:tRNA-dihydrouridine synthase
MTNGDILAQNDQSAQQGTSSPNPIAPVALPVYDHVAKPVQSGTQDAISPRERRSMKELVKQYLDQGISRRTLMANLSAAGLSAVAANTVAQALAPVSAQAAAAAPGAVCAT